MGQGHHILPDWILLDGMSETTPLEDQVVESIVVRSGSGAEACWASPNDNHVIYFLGHAMLSYSLLSATAEYYIVADSMEYFHNHKQTGAAFSGSNNIHILLVVMLLAFRRQRMQENSTCQV
jgi:hypothetical protein